MSSTRYYTFNGATVAVRTAAGVKYLAGDPHGTAQTAIDAVSGALTRRRVDPFGVSRDPTPVPWPGERGFVGGTVDASTGLTQLGARAYDPANGRFLSGDPVIDPSDPQQLNGYAYANNNPETFADPSGQMYRNDDPNGGDWYTDYPTPGKFGQLPKPVRTVWQHRGWITMPVPTAIGCHLLGSCRKAEALSNVLFDAGTGVEDTDGCFGHGKRGSCVWLAIGFTPIKPLRALKFAKDFTKLTAVVRAGDDASRVAKGGRAVKDAASLACHSFAAGTRVVLADGSQQAIEKVKVGDRVRTTDPATGKTVIRAVTALHRNHDTDLTDLTVRDQAGHVATIHTTAHHQFWDDTRHTWAAAASLSIGGRLHALVDGRVSVAAVHLLAGASQMYDLTVNDVHTYYVLAGDTPVLVHNCTFHTAGGPRVRPVTDIDVDPEGLVHAPSARDLADLNVQGLSTYDTVEHLRNQRLTGQVRSPTEPLPDGRYLRRVKMDRRRSDQEMWDAVVAAEREVTKRRAEFYQHATARVEILATALNGSAWELGSALIFLQSLYDDVPNLLDQLFDLAVVDRCAVDAQLAITRGPRDLVLAEIERTLPNRLSTADATDYGWLAVLLIKLEAWRSLKHLVEQAQLSMDPEINDIATNIMDRYTPMLKSL